ncbi:hypothetical protein CCHR01_19688 [Colletotrichum chrysophilum]|uniref:Uncharacterized protein n=1 Tax=Colletotrichum chrysophilum TaxID=1836956 RepID=A0AAD9E6Z8_9PEZI|nr:hypothetical protein CCHR01_19688 [Colletotrichum chrysophilum]
MIVSKSLTNAQIARFVGCSTRSVSHIRSNLRCFGTTKAPSNAVDRPRAITTPILQALLARLTEKPHMYQDEMASFVWKEFEVLVTTQCIAVCWPSKPSSIIGSEGGDIMMERGVVGILMADTFKNCSMVHIQCGKISQLMDALLVSCRS